MKFSHSLDLILLKYSNSGRFSSKYYKLSIGRRPAKYNFYSIKSIPFQAGVSLILAEFLIIKLPLQLKRH